MKKSIKRFLIISQVLGWSALVASACTDEQVKTISQSITTNNKEDGSKAHSLNSSQKETETTNHQESKMSESEQSSKTGDKTEKGNSATHSKNTLNHDSTTPKSKGNQGAGEGPGGKSQSLQGSEGDDDQHGTDGSASVPSKSGPTASKEKEDKKSQEQVSEPGTEASTGKPNAAKGEATHSTQSGVKEQETVKGKGMGADSQDPAPASALGPTTKATEGHQHQSGPSGAASHKAT